MHPAILSVIPQRWRAVVIFIVVALALALMFDRPVWEELKEGAVGAWLESIINPNPAPTIAPPAQDSDAQRDLELYNVLNHERLRESAPIVLPTPLSPIALPTVGTINGGTLAPLTPMQWSALQRELESAPIALPTLGPPIALPTIGAYDGGALAPLAPMQDSTGQSGP
ncbi:MAG TPA: hypothetical protein VNF45_09065 [Candidatus Binataceae bacterium]|nr:hypothetical protein [Candidatus Binataceae bacterium]